MSRRILASEATIAIRGPDGVSMNKLERVKTLEFEQPPADELYFDTTPSPLGELEAAAMRTGDLVLADLYRQAADGQLVETGSDTLDSLAYAYGQIWEGRDR